MFSRQHQFEIAVRKSSGRKYFDAGDILGLLLKIDTVHSVALGLAVSGVYAGGDYTPDAKMLLSYIEKWIEEIESVKRGERQLSVV